MIERRRIAASSTTFAFPNTAADAVELWIGNAATGAVHRVPGVKLNPMLGSETQWMPDQRTLVADAKAAVDEAVRLGVADPDRIGVTGHSHGALMTVNLIAHSELFRAGVATSGSYNKLYEAVRGNGGTARLVMLPHEPHRYSAMESNEQLIYEMVRCRLAIKVRRRPSNYFL